MHDCALRPGCRIGPFLWAACFCCASVLAQFPVLLPHQGRIAVSNVYFHGEGRFKFALMDASGGRTYWRNAPDLDGDGQPDAAVLVTVQRGLYSLSLGDTGLVNMAPLDAATLAEPSLFLRVWFDDGSHGFEQLRPDVRLWVPPYAQTAGGVPDGAITPSKLAPETLAPLQGQLAALRTDLHGLSNRHESLVASLGQGLPPGVPVVSSRPDDPSLLGQGFVMAMEMPAPGWAAGSTIGEPLPRYGHTAVWTGSEMWIFGGTLPDLTHVTSTGGRYRPDADAWAPLPSSGAPSARTGHGAVWTGQAMIVWGGSGEGQFYNTGARLRPGESTWQSLSTLNVPTGRDGHGIAWTGTRMVVWGGRNFTGLLNDGALYDPATDSWSPLPTNGAPAPRTAATVLWTGNSLIVWGGQGISGKLGDGARLRFDDQGDPLGWVPLSTSNAPSPRTGHSAVWTGQFLIIWGGLTESGLTNDGARYDPAADVWEPLSSHQAPAARQLHNAVWTGREMLVLSGLGADGNSPPPHAYAPASDTWRPLTLAGNPPGRSQATAIWTGKQVLHFGGRLGTTVLAALYWIEPRQAWYLYVKP